MSKSDPSLEWVNTPRQERSQKTLEKLLDAAEELIREGGLDAVTVPAVVKRAGSSVGSFYARFPDKDALLVTLHQRACETTIADADRALDPARWADHSLEEIIAGTVAFAVRAFGSRRSIMTAFHRALGGDPGYAERRARNGIELGVRVLRLIMPHAGRIGHELPEVAIPMVLRVVTATLEQQNSLSSAGKKELDVPAETLERELTRMVLAYLEVKTASRRAS